MRTEQLSLQDGKATHAVTAFYPSATTPSLQRTGEAVLAASEVASKLLRVAKQSNNTMNYSAECTSAAESKGGQEPTRKALLHARGKEGQALQARLLRCPFLGRQGCM